MAISNNLSFKQFLSRSYDTYILSNKITFKNEQDDSFALSTNLLVDSIELLLKSISYLLNSNFIESHDYKKILTADDENKYGIRNIIINLNNNPYFDGKLIHEFKYSDSETEVKERDIKKGSDPDFYKKFKLKDYQNLNELYINLKNKTFEAYNDIFKNNEKIKIKIDSNQELLNFIINSYSKIDKIFKIYSSKISFNYSDIKFLLKCYFDNSFDFINNWIQLIDADDYYNYDNYETIKEITSIQFLDYWLNENSKDDQFIQKIELYTNILKDFNEYCKIKFMVQ